MAYFLRRLLYGGKMDADVKVPENFFLKPGYISRGACAYFEDSMIATEGIVHQPDVYVFAEYLGRKFGCTHILDIGCGRGYKLVKLHPEFKLVGIDFGANIDYCQKNHSVGQWLAFNLEKPHQAILPPEIMKKTLVVCSDVIEHLYDPTGLLKTLDNCLEYAPVAILSTPERDLVRGYSEMEPPGNPAHVREWNREEFNRLLDTLSFDIVFTGLTCNNDHDWAKKTILSILHGKQIPRRKITVPDNFGVVAFMTAYNEEDIIFHSISRLIRTGIDVYLIDNWSTDKTVAMVEPLLGNGLIGIERFPLGGSTGYYDWERLMMRVEELARAIPAEWFIHHDVDEIRESPWPEITLREALYFVDRLGFNAVDHTVINFLPVDNGFLPGSDFGNYFTYWEFGRRPGHFQQIKAWKNLCQTLTLASTGGHDVDFTGRKVFPYKFLLRHYPVRSQEHGEKKVLTERKPRFNPEERAVRGWHGHYDHIENGHNFLFDPQLLNHYDSASFYQDYLVERISGIGIVRPKGIESQVPIKAGLFRWLRDLFER